VPSGKNRLAGDIRQVFGQLFVSVWSGRNELLQCGGIRSVFFESLDPRFARMTMNPHRLRGTLGRLQLGKARRMVDAILRHFTVGGPLAA
jgi:hypothetical protein